MEQAPGKVTLVTDKTLQYRVDSHHCISAVLEVMRSIFGAIFWACAPTRFVHFPATYFARANIGKHKHLDLYIAGTIFG